MVVKKKAMKVEAVALDEEKLCKLIASLSVDGGADGVRHLAQTSQTCLKSTDPVSQIQSIKKAGSQLEASSEDQAGSTSDACSNALASVYTSVRAKNPSRRAVASALSSVPEWLQGRTADSSSACLSDCVSSPCPDRHPHTIDTISACLDGFPLGERCVNKSSLEVLKFICKVLHEYLHQNSGLAGRHIAQAQSMQSCSAAVKTSMSVLQRCQAALGEVSPAEQDTSGDLSSCYTHILTDEEFIQAVQSTAGMAVVSLIRFVMGSGEEVASVVCASSLSSAQGLEPVPQWLRRRCEPLCSSGRPPGVSSYSCHGALAMSSWRGSSPGPRWEELSSSVPKTLSDSDVSVKESSTAMAVARVLTSWSGAALDCSQEETRLCPPGLCAALCGGSESQRHSSEHVYSHWEHPSDGVRHQTRSSFHNSSQSHQHTKPRGSDPAEDPYISELTHSSSGSEWHMRGKYGASGCSVELYGAERSSSVQPSSPSRLSESMGDQTSAPYASDLSERLFVSHKAQSAASEETDDWMERWHRTWVNPSSHVSCHTRPDQTTYISDYFSPKSLRCSPSSSTHMVRASQDTRPRSTGPSSSRGALGASMTCSRAARAQGVAASSDEGSWGGLVPLSSSQQALIHKHDQVRMDASGLVCESHRSTELVTSQEMGLIRHFLPPNLNSQSPGIRQQTISSSKKSLCRVKDSSQSRQKRLVHEREQEGRAQEQHVSHQYKEFLRWMCGKSSEVLLPGASFSNCLMSLNSSNSSGQLFSFTAEPDSFASGEVVTPEHSRNVSYCVASNFSEVKQSATSLSRSLPPSAVGLEAPETMGCVLQAASDLSTSTKPYDSVTAAHLLHSSLHQSESIPVSSRRVQDQGSDLPVGPPPAQASETLVLELNASAVVRFSSRLSQRESSGAESSLLQAAASFPLYGRAHCITAVSQHLKSECSSQTEQWRGSVSESIAVCYRMSDVVSPVVQSSSPEGLIPMDTDSETSGGSSRISQEIQPRDTNDFFNSARESETPCGDDGAQSQTRHTPPSQTDGEGYRVTAQMVSVCCWRSMKEVAMLLGQLCHSSPSRYTGENESTRPGLITEEQVEGVGSYFRQQLSQSRHRGAFESAYVGFVRLTDMLCRSGSRTLQELPSRWLSEVSEEVKSSDPTSKSCATRRSAGIPFYIQASLSSEPKSSSCSSSKMTMRESISSAMPSADRNTDSSTVPQVHASNILRASYRDTRLGENVIPFVSDGMHAAVSGFTSPVWAVRNSSTLLFSTLITRIFGVKKGKDEHSKKNRMTGREFFTRFPALYPFLSTQSEEAAATVESDSGHVKLHPSSFLSSLVLSRLYPSPMDGSSSPSGLAPFRPLIMRCSRSAVYRTREMAARALVPFVSVTQVPSIVSASSQELPLEPGPGIQHNHIHGTSSQVSFSSRSFQTDSHRPSPARSGIGEALHQRMWLASRHNSCLVTRGAFLDVLMCLCGTKTSLSEDSEVDSLRQMALSVLMASELITPDSSPLVPGTEQYLLSLAQVGLSASVDFPASWRGSEQRKPLLDSSSHSPHYEVRELASEGISRKSQEHEGDGKKRSPSWSDETTVSDSTNMAVRETHQQSLAKVSQVLCVLNSSRELLWKDGAKTLSSKEVSLHLLTSAENFTHSMESLSAASTSASQSVVESVSSDHQDPGAAACLAQWGASVCSCSGEEQPVEVKSMVAKVSVTCSSTSMTNPHSPSGFPATLSSWRSSFTLSQDEDQDVRDSASDFTSSVPAHSLRKDVAGVSMCPPAALDLGVELSCGMFELWGQMGAGILALTQWSSGEEEEEEEEDGNAEEEADETSCSTKHTSVVRHQGFFSPPTPSGSSSDEQQTAACLGSVQRCKPRSRILKCTIMNK